MPHAIAGPDGREPAGLVSVICSASADEAQEQLVRFPTPHTGRHADCEPAHPQTMHTPSDRSEASSRLARGLYSAFTLESTLLMALPNTAIKKTIRASNLIDEVIVRATIQVYDRCFSSSLLPAELNPGRARFANSNRATMNSAGYHGSFTLLHYLA